MRQDLEELPEKLTRSNWKSWKNAIEKHARKEGVWKYCNPDAPGEYYAELHEPEKPHISTARPEVKSIVELGEDDFIELSSIVDQYWKQMRGYENIQTKLQVILELIEDHVDDEHFDLIKHAKTPLEQMTVLSDKFKKFRLEDLQPRWERIQELANKPDAQELFKLWNALFTDCDGYVSSSARRRDAFWDCVETAGDLSRNQLPLTSQHWIQTADHVELKACGYDRAQPRLSARRDSITSQHWIEKSELFQPRDGDYCAQLRSPARRESVTSQDWVKTPGDSESRNYGNYCVQPRSPTRREPESTTSLGWIKTPECSESRNYGDCCAQPRTPTRRESITSLQCTEALDHSKSSNSEDDYTKFSSPAKREPESTTSLNFIETRNDSELRNYSDSCAQLRSRAKRGPIASQYRVGYYEPVVSTEHTSLSPSSSSMTGQSDQCEEVSGDNLEITGLLQRLGLLGTKESEN
ncbi:hypothetical protein N7453_010166 [Penicillium expansum]|nr:hypothetical protein N7453_010166 [Penicillium expansum]